MKHYGLIGKTLSHSFSKSFFTEKFTKEGITAEYSNYELAEISDFKMLLKENVFDGLNVTIPYKEAVIPFLDSLSEEAQQIGAVNTIQFKDGSLIGHNTDAHGFHQCIKPFLLNTHHRAMILGTGGASKAVAYILKKIGLDVIFISRNPKAANEFTYEDINALMVDAFGLIVNTTPLGTFPNVNEKPNFPTQHLTKDHLVVDLIYNPEKTQLLKEAEEQGAVVLNGHTMLKEQALKAYSIWQ